MDTHLKKIITTTVKIGTQATTMLPKGAVYIFSTLVVCLALSFPRVSGAVGLADFCTAQSGTFVADTCTLTSGGLLNEILDIDPGQTLMVPVTQTLNINLEGVISGGDGTIDNKGTINIDGMILGSDGLIINEGTISNYNSFSGDENRILNSGIINNEGEFSGGETQILNTGTINNYSLFGIGDPARLTVQGGGVVNNYNLLDNFGSISIEDGIVNNELSGTINLWDDGRLTIGNNGIFANRGTVKIRGDIDNAGGGLFDNLSGIVNNDGRIRNRCGIFIGTIPTTGNPIIDLCPPEDQIEAIVDNWEEDGDITPGQRNSLRSKLAHIRIHIARGQITAACNELNALINEVRALVRARKVMPPESDALIDAANEMKASIGCGR